MDSISALYTANCNVLIYVSFRCCVFSFTDTGMNCVLFQNDHYILCLLNMSLVCPLINMYGLFVVSA